MALCRAHIANAEEGTSSLQPDPTHWKKRWKEKKEDEDESKRKGERMR